MTGPREGRTILLTLDDILDCIRCEHMVVGKETVIVDNARPIDSANERSISFCSKRGELGRKLIGESSAAVMIIGPEHEETCRELGRGTCIIVSDPRLAFARVLARHFEKERPTGVHPTAVIGEGVTVGEGAYIGPFCTVGDNVTIGAGSLLMASVVLFDNVRLGRNVVIHSGAVIGVDGFGYGRNPEGTLEKFPQIGAVEIEDEVEIGSNSCVARGALLNTVIGRGTKIDNLVHIAHNVRIGENCLIIAHAQIAGSVRIGNRCWLAPSCTINTGVTIGDDAMVALGSVVVHDVTPGAFVAGNPARPTIRKG